MTQRKQIQKFGPPDETELTAHTACNSRQRKARSSEVYNNWNKMFFFIAFPGRAGELFVITSDSASLSYRSCG